MDRAQWDYDLSELCGGSSDPDAGKLANRIEAHILGLEREVVRLRRYWKPIASAPTDGSRFLIERDIPSDTSMCIAFWHDGQDTPAWVHSDARGNNVDLNIYTMWMPLPSPPAFSRQPVIAGDSDTESEDG